MAKDMELLPDNVILKLSEEESSNIILSYSDTVEIGTFTNILNSYLQKKEYNKFWSILSACNKSSIYSNELLETALITAFSEPTLDKVFSENTNEIFIQGLALFLKNQTRFTTPQIKKTMGSCANYIFRMSIRYGNDEIRDILSDYKENDELDYHKKALADMFSNKKLEEAYSLMFHSKNHVFNSSEVLRTCLQSGVVDYDFYEKIITQFNLDINGVGNTPTNKEMTWNFIHACIMEGKQSVSSLFKKTVTNFGKQINLDALFTFYRKSAYAYVKHDVLDCLFESSIPQKLKLDRLSLILEHCTITEKVIAKISSFILSEENIAHYYDHPIYVEIFKHPVFNSKSFDKDNVLASILSRDNSKLVKEIRIQHHHTVNPIVIILQKFAEYSQHVEQIKIQPLQVWAEKQNNNFCEDTAKYLLKTYPVKDINFNTPSDLIEFFKKNGVNIPKKQTFFGKFFNIFDKQQENQAIQIEQPGNLLGSHLSFNTAVYSQVKDEDIGKLISAIQFHSEQFEVLCGKSLNYENQHYMENTLPKFLNKTIENYLHFATMDENEAKNNVLVQLQLLNKKTFEVLNEELQSEKDNAAKNGRVVGKLIKQIT